MVCRRGQPGEGSQTLWDMGGTVFMALGFGRQLPPGLAGGKTPGYMGGGEAREGGAREDHSRSASQGPRCSHAIPHPECGLRFRVRGSGLNLLHRNVQRFRGGLVFKARGIPYHAQNPRCSHGIPHPESSRGGEGRPTDSRTLRL